MVFFAVVTAEAHEIGTTRVNALFRHDRTYVIDIATAPEPLQRRRVTEEMLLDASEVRFGSQRVTPRLKMLPGPVIRLQGSIPDGAREFTWRYGLTFATYALTTTVEGEPPATQWVNGDEAAKPASLGAVASPPLRLRVAREYLSLGFTHIIPHGLDHILFVLGIFLLSMRVKDVLAQVTAFTIAHTITLGLTIYGVIGAPARIVEPMIALSIAYVAIENLTTSRLHPWRVALVFAFGLLHGMGFAGVLQELGLPRSRFVTALVAFNAGVEMGQLAVIAAAFAALGWFRKAPSMRRRVVVPASFVIAAIGLFWTIERSFFQS